MAKTTTFEVQSFRNGSWMIDSIYDDREMAVYTARNLLESRHHASVRVVSESYDEVTAESSSKVVFKDEKRALAKMKLAKAAEKKKEAKKEDAPQKKVEKDDSFMRYFIMLVLSLGGILLVVLVLLFIYLEAMGK